MSWRMEKKMCSCDDLTVLWSCEKGRAGMEYHEPHLYSTIYSRCIQVLISGTKPSKGEREREMLPSYVTSPVCCDSQSFLSRPLVITTLSHLCPKICILRIGLHSYNVGWHQTPSSLNLIFIII